MDSANRQIDLVNAGGRTLGCVRCGNVQQYAAVGDAIAAGWRSVEGDQGRLLCPDCARPQFGPSNRRSTRAALAAARSKRKPARARH